MIQKKDIQKINYDGPVWCATVPNGLLVTRRKGKILISGNSNANYSSSLVAQNPFVREIEEWQDFFASFYKELYRIAVETKIEARELPENISTDCRVTFPPMLRDDVDKLAKAYEVLFKYKIVSKKTWRGIMGLDDDEEKGYIDGEMEDDDFGLGPGVIPGQGTPAQGNPNTPRSNSPFNMPVAPVNQFGAEREALVVELVRALKDHDWETITDLVDKFEALEEEITELKTNVLIQHGYDIEEARKKLAEQDWIYLIHHMHIPDKESEMEILHHCELFEKKNMKGEEYKQAHKKEGKLFQHILLIDNLDLSPKIVYDHLNNGFKVVIRDINKEKYAVLSGLANIKKTKWSDQDK